MIFPNAKILNPFECVARRGRKRTPEWIRAWTAEWIGKRIGISAIQAAQSG